MTAPISNGPATTRLHHYAGHYYRASDCESIAWSLQEISVSGWSGRAADRFHEHFKLQPDKWWCASATFGRAADAWEVYASTLEQAQARAAQAKFSYEGPTSI